MKFFEVIDNVQTSQAKASRPALGSSFIFQGPHTVDLNAGDGAGICQGWVPTVDDLNGADWFIIAPPAAPSEPEEAPLPEV